MLSPINLDDIYIKVAKALNANPDTVKNVGDHMFKTIRKYLEYPKFPEVHISRYMYFIPDVNVLMTRVMAIKKGIKMNHISNAYPIHVLDTLEEVVTRTLKGKQLPYKFRKAEYEREKRAKSNAKKSYA